MKATLRQKQIAMLTKNLEKSRVGRKGKPTRSYSATYRKFVQRVPDYERRKKAAAVRVHLGKNGGNLKQTATYWGMEVIDLIRLLSSTWINDKD